MSGESRHDRRDAQGALRTYIALGEQHIVNLAARPEALEHVERQLVGGLVDTLQPQQLAGLEREGGWGGLREGRGARRNDKARPESAA